MSSPKSTSPCGFPAVSSAFDTSSPASPDWRIRSSRPLVFSNSARTSSETANESCVTSTTSVALPPSPPHAAAGDGKGEPECQQERGDVLVTPCHLASPVSGPGRTASRTPLSRLMRAVSSTKTFETPRLEPGSRVSPSSGYASPRCARLRPGRALRTAKAALPAARTAPARGGSRAPEQRRCQHRARRPHSVGKRGAGTVENRWSSRSPTTARTTIRAG